MQHWSQRHHGKPLCLNWLLCCSQHIVEEAPSAMGPGKMTKEGFVNNTSFVLYRGYTACWWARIQQISYPATDKSAFPQRCDFREPADQSRNIPSHPFPSWFFCSMANYLQLVASVAWGKISSRNKVFCLCQVQASLCRNWDLWQLSHLKVGRSI